MKTKMPLRERMELLGEFRDRRLSDTDFELRAPITDDASPVFVGHAAVFDTRTAIGNPLTWGFYEEIASGAFKETLSKGDPLFLVNHNSDLPVARVSVGDLRLAEDKVGLAVEADLDQEVSYIRDMTRNIERRRVTGMSFGFRVVDDEWHVEKVSTSDGQEAEVEVRTINAVELFEVSTTPFPAYPTTDAALRALQHRDDPDPLGRRNDLLHPDGGEPAAATRTDDAEEPAEATPRRLVVGDQMRALAARYGLPA